MYIKNWQLFPNPNTLINKYVETGKSIMKKSEGF